MKYFMVIMGLILFLSACDPDTISEDACDDTMPCAVSDLSSAEGIATVSDDVEKIEVYHFHGTNQCFSCETVGAFAEKTVNTYYSDLVDSGKMEFKSVNAELQQNRDATVKYGATGSSLWIGTYMNGEFHKEEITNVWYKVRDEAGYLAYLREILDKRLTGDLT